MPSVANPGQDEAGQVLVALVGGLVAVLVGVLVLGAAAQGGGRQWGAHRAADLAARAGARAMHERYFQLFEPVLIDGRPNPSHLAKNAYLAAGRDAAAH